MTYLKDLKEAWEAPRWQGLIRGFKDKPPKVKVAELALWLQMGDYETPREQWKRKVQVNEYLKRMAEQGLLKSGPFVDDRGLMHYEYPGEAKV